MANTPNKSYRIYMGFSRDPDDDVNHLTLDVEDALPNHPVFINLPVSLADLEQQRLALQAAITEARKGGTDRTRAKKTAKQTVTDSLVKIALYCQGLARHDLDILLSSGFEVVSTNHTPGPLDTPAIMDILNNVSGQLTVRGIGVLNGARLMVLQPTTPGTLYTIQFCALGGSTSQSQWSHPVTLMAT
jgi:hypothetical protein